MASVGRRRRCQRKRCLVLRQTQPYLLLSPPFLLPAPSCPACVRREVRSFAASLAWPKGSSKRPKSAVFLFLLERSAPQQGDDGRGVRGRYAMGYRLKEGRKEGTRRDRANGPTAITGLHSGKRGRERERERGVYGDGVKTIRQTVERAGGRRGAGGRSGTCQNTRWRQLCA